MLKKNYLKQTERLNRLFQTLSNNIVDRAVTGVGVLVDLAVADTLKAPSPVQSGPEAADPRKHIKVTNQMLFISLLERPQKAEDAVIHVPGLLRLLCCFFC